MNCKEFVKSESLANIFEICQNGVFFNVGFVKAHCLGNKKTTLHNTVCAVSLKVCFVCKIM